MTDFVFIKPLSEARKFSNLSCGFLGKSRGKHFPNWQCDFDWDMNVTSSFSLAKHPFKVEYSFNKNKCEVSVDWLSPGELTNDFHQTHTQFAFSHTCYLHLKNHFSRKSGHSCLVSFFRTGFTIFQSESCFNLGHIAKKDKNILWKHSLLHKQNKYRITKVYLIGCPRLQAINIKHWRRSRYGHVSAHDQARQLQQFHEKTLRQSSIKVLQALDVEWVWGLIYYRAVHQRKRMSWRKWREVNFFFF